jgi:hypothetical protein
MAVAAGSQGSVPQEPVLCTPKAPPSAGSPDRPSLHPREQSSAGYRGTAGATLTFGCNDRCINQKAARRLCALASGVEASSSMAVANLGGGN